MKYLRQSEPEAFERDSQHEGAEVHLNGVSLGISITARKCQSDTRLANGNIRMQDGIQDGGLWGPNDLVDSVKKRDNATERICERYGVKIKSRAIVIKNNFPKKKPPTFIYLIISSAKPTNALKMDLRTKKVPKCFLWKLQIFLVELYNHNWTWDKIGEKIVYNIREKKRKT